MTPACVDGSVGLYFLSGTEPTEKCTYHTSVQNLQDLGIQRIREGFGDFSGGTGDIDDDGLIIDPSIYLTPEELKNLQDANSEMSLEDILKESGVHDLPGVKVEVIPVQPGQGEASGAGATPAPTGTTPESGATPEAGTPSTPGASTPPTTPEAGTPPPTPGTVPTP